MYRILFALTLSTLFLSSCKNQIKDNMAQEHKYTNDLINETSPYLLQHAHNPVDWKPWNQETLDLAKKENKLIVISVGYAACHWCHVMEHESFENDSVAKIMNDNFINIKVDREERPDVDQVYMDAVQLMTGSGGWPLNCITLPDGRPIFGGTYFPKDNWISVLHQLSDLYKNSPEKAIEYAEKLTEGIQKTSLVALNTDEAIFEVDSIIASIDNWKTRFDTKLGGMTGAPKFPMPTNYQFLLRYGVQGKSKFISNYVHNTLTKMAYGGMYDQVGGGFARYSVDEKWHVPHFEKMLYDNAQLVSLYSDAYQVYNEDLYKEIVTETLTFVERELMSDEGAFYSSLDADSNTPEGELEEGAFYVWTKEELKQIITSDFEIFEDYYNINSYGFWEKENYVLIRNSSDLAIANKYGLTLEKVKSKVENWKQILLKERSKKERPRLDDKTLTSWNALMLKGYVDAYRVFDNQHYLDIATKNAKFLISKQLREDGGLNHNYKNGKSTINGYLEDYSAVIDAFISLYEVTLDEQWLNTAKQLTDYTFDHFFDTKSGMFYFTSDEDKDLIARKMEVADNVIPASNSMMARNLAKLSHYYSNSHYLKTSRQMLNNVKSDMIKYPSGYSNWLQLKSDFASHYYEIAISGKDALSKLKEINKTYIPNKLIAGAIGESAVPLMEGRYNEDNTFIYICVDGACKLPETEVDKALNQLEKHF
ncbi:thioredoxin domain-containing protein [Urechidicola croceus]|uniref:Thioredoxin domain-containing protein n=1 Tax=Urechidicola croceus TaxID=1850246 RepID=A0A1D8P8B6_9FLAO|nr:thioredoxin domain-containing protein [Urechidicola croceus]AOW20828.1 thioredoxin domain-containing protein [Urechidicola croceus]